jgi:hypothetical protein
MIKICHSEFPDIFSGNATENKNPYLFYSIFASYFNIIYGIKNALSIISEDERLYNNIR